MSTEREVREFELKINGETLTVKARDWFGDGSKFGTLEAVGLARFRTGTKLWPSLVFFWRNRDGSYSPDLRPVHLNKHTMIVAWNDEKYEKAKSRHRG